MTLSLSGRSSPYLGKITPPPVVKIIVLSTFTPVYSALHLFFSIFIAVRTVTRIRALVRVNISVLKGQMKTLHPDALSLRLSSSYRRSLAHILNAAPALSDCSICSKPILTIIRSLITSPSCKLLVLWSTHSFFRFVPFSLHRASSMDTHSIFQLSLLLHTVNPL